MDAGVSAALAASNLRRLPAASLRRLLHRSRTVRIRAGTVTHRAGESAEHVELVVDGLVRVFLTAPDGRSLTVRYCRPGALIGVLSLFRPGFSMPAWTQAVLDTRLLVMCPDIVRRAASDDVHVADALLTELAERAQGFVLEIAGSAFSTVRERVARHLLDLASEEARATGGGALLTAPVSQRELAEAVGSVREVVVRVLHDLHECGVVETHRERIVIVDPVRLSEERTGT